MEGQVRVWSLWNSYLFSHQRTEPSECLREILLGGEVKHGFTPQNDMYPCRVIPFDHHKTDAHSQDSVTVQLSQAYDVMALRDVALMSSSPLFHFHLLDCAFWTYQLLLDNLWYLICCFWPSDTSVIYLQVFHDTNHNYFVVSRELMSFETVQVCAAIIRWWP